MSAEKVRIRWTCPCGERHRWKHDREEVECSGPMSALRCDKCGKTSKARLRTCRYEVLE